MGYIEGTNREQLTYWSLEDLVDDDSMVRVIDRFIDICDLEKLGFTRTQPSHTGRPGYAPKPLAKLYVYGYENGVRSSRKLEKESKRNVEVMWLTESLAPDHKTIAEFRRLNIRPLQKLFREFVKLCRSWELVGGELIAVDGAKFKASNNKKANFSRKKLDDRLKRLDEKIALYMDQLEEEDQKDQTDQTDSATTEGLRELLERKDLYEQYLAELNKTGDNELSTTDPDARLMGNNRSGVEMSYNVQSAVDSKHHIILDYDVSKNPSDQVQLAKAAKRLLRLKFRRFSLLGDKGYYNGADLSKLKKFKVKAIVSRPKPSNPKNQPEQFHTQQFAYDPTTDTFCCPNNETLPLRCRRSDGRNIYHNKKACADCPHVTDCITGKSGYRIVTRNQYAKVCEEADAWFKANQHLYQLRQQIVEHPFGTIKSSMNGGHFLLRTRRKVRAEVALLFLAYNLKRAVNVLGFVSIMERLDAIRGAFFAFLHRSLPFAFNRSLC